MRRLTASRLCTRISFVLFLAAACEAKAESSGERGPGPARGPSGRGGR